MILHLLMATISIAPIQEALAKHGPKTPVGSLLRSAEWARLPLSLTESSQFSSAVESMRLLSRIQGGVKDLLAHHRDEHGALTDRSGLIRDLTAIAEEEGLAPSDPELKGTIQDVTSEARARLIVETQVGKAYGYANWKAGQDPDALDATPAQELVRIRDSAEPRDWRRRWVKAGGSIFSGERMIALKGDPVWSGISRFGTPYPPYDFNSGMWVEDVTRAEAVELGLITEEQVVQPDEQDFNAKLEASTRGLDDRSISMLKHFFGNQITVDGDSIRWTGGGS